MRINRQHLRVLGISLLGVLVLSPGLIGQSEPSSVEGRPLTTDWTSRHVVLSRPANAEQARLVQRSHRYWQQLARESFAPLLERGNGAAPPAIPQFGVDGLVSAGNHLERDWAQDMGSGATAGAGNYPAKYSFSSTTASCSSDFVVYGTGLVGEPLAQANIVAFNNLYSGCTGTVPSVYWAYQIGQDSTVTTSPVFSGDGTQVAYVQTNALGHGIIVLLKWAASTTETITDPLTLFKTTRSLYPSCSAPCFTTVGMVNSSDTLDADTQSSVFYDYDADTAYVGDTSGYLHKYTPFFKGVPGEVTTGGWPVQVNPGSPTPLTSPVHDDTSGNVFVADIGGFLYLVDPSGGVTISGQLDFSYDLDNGAPGIVEAPIVDSTSGFVYVFVPSDGSGGCAIGATIYDCTAIFRLTTSFPSGDTGSEAVIGSSTVEPASPNPLYIGAFDSTYLNSGTGSGHLYVCGNTGGPPILYQVTIQDGVLGTVTAGPVLSTSSSTPCSPVTDILNPNASGGATEWIFASAQNGGASSGCSSGGCVFNFKDTSWEPSTAYLVGQEILDSNLHIEVVSVAGTSGKSVPFWNIATGGSTADHGVTWLDQGPASAFTPSAWVKNHHYAKGVEILDPNNNIELVTDTGGGTSGGTIPNFNQTAGGTTTDNTITWTNVGAIATAAMATAGGTSGIIIDNTVGSSTQPGASQVYFSTLSNQACGTTGTGGCAVQASQAALK